MLVICFYLWSKLASWTVTSFLPYIDGEILTTLRNSDDPLSCSSINFVFFVYIFSERDEHAEFSVKWKTHRDILVYCNTVSHFFKIFENCDNENQLYGLLPSVMTLWTVIETTSLPSHVCYNISIIMIWLVDRTTNPVIRCIYKTVQNMPVSGKFEARSYSVRDEINFFFNDIFFGILPLLAALRTSTPFPSYFCILKSLSTSNF